MSCVGLHENQTSNNDQGCTSHAKVAPRAPNAAPAVQKQPRTSGDQASAGSPQRVKGGAPATQKELQENAPAKQKQDQLSGGDQARAGRPQRVKVVHLPHIKVAPEAPNAAPAIK